jgi:hypothetical protein
MKDLAIITSHPNLLTIHEGLIDQSKLKMIDDDDEFEKQTTVSMPNTTWMMMPPTAASMATMMTYKTRIWTPRLGTLAV